jgi:hypothetical protein
MNGYRFDMVIETEAELSDELLVEVSIELRDAFMSFLKSKRIGSAINGDIDVSKCKCDKNYTTFTGTYITDITGEK